MNLLFVTVAVLASVTAGYAQTSAPSGTTQGYDYDQSIQSATLRDHFAIDLGLWLPFGELAERGNMEAGFGFNIHFWKGLSEETFVVGSVGNSWMSMSGTIETDTGTVDLSPLSFSASPMLGGIGQVFTFGEFRAYASVHAGATFINLTTSQGLPATFIENNTFFTAGIGLGGGYRVASWASILFMSRYMQMFGEDFAHIDLGMGASFHW